MATTSSRRQKLLDKKAQLDAQLRQLDARERVQERKRDTRRKVIAGGMALKHAEIDDEFAAAMFKLINRYVTRPQDRNLFREIFPELGDAAPSEKAVEQNSTPPVWQTFSKEAG